jgi:hypothetical protein
MSYISPLRRLPREIINNLVHICLDEGVELTVMTQICGTIRDIVHGMPDIWSRIILGFGYRYDVESVRNRLLSR